MSKFTLAYLSLVDRMAEVGVLRKGAARLERLDAVRNIKEINALCRGAIVLLSSHVEAYVKEVGEITLDAYAANGVDRSRFDIRLFYHISKDFVDEIKDTSDPTKIATKLFDFIRNDSAFWAQSGPFPQSIPADRFNSGFANPTFKKIKSYFNRFGYDTYGSDMHVELRARSAVVINNLDQIVNTRNSIAHGDYSASRTPRDVADMAELAKVFCRATDIVFARWCGSKHCSIRTR